MSLEFDNGYRVLTWVHARYSNESQRDKLSSTILNYFAELKINAYLGACFGKFSRVIDFYSESAKIATYHLGKVKMFYQKIPLIVLFLFNCANRLKVAVALGTINSQYEPILFLNLKTVIYLTMIFLAIVNNYKLNPDYLLKPIGIVACTLS